MLYGIVFEDERNICLSVLFRDDFEGFNVPLVEIDNMELISSS